MNRDALQNVCTMPLVFKEHGDVSMLELLRQSGYLEHSEAITKDVTVIGVEGPAWLLADFEDRWADDALRQDILDVARALESEASILGVSAHLLGTGHKPADEAV